MLAIGINQDLQGQAVLIATGGCDDGFFDIHNVLLSARLRET